MLMTTLLFVPTFITVQLNQSLMHQITKTTTMTTKMVWNWNLSEFFFVSNIRWMWVIRIKLEYLLIIPLSIDYPPKCTTQNWIMHRINSSISNLHCPNSSLYCFFFQRDKKKIVINNYLSEAKEKRFSATVPL